MAAELLFEPLNMKDSHFMWSQKVDQNRLAKGFDTDGNSYEFHQRDIANGADDLLTTVEDYGKFLTAVMNGYGLSDSIFKNMQANQVATKKANISAWALKNTHSKTATTPCLMAVLIKASKP